MNRLVNVLGINFINKSFREMIAVITERIENEKKTFIVTANPEIVMYANEDKAFKQIIETADFVTPDGIGIVIASKMLNNPIEERVTGFDMTMELLRLANEKQWKVYLLGGKQEVNDLAAEKMKKQFPSMKLVGHHDGYFSWEDEKLPKEIKSLKPDLVLVALGYPRQEQWISEHIGSFSKGIFIGVGGTIDVIAGTVKRAPEFWQKAKLEWLYRLIKQPSRWRRMLALPKFLVEIIKVRIFPR